MNTPDFTPYAQSNAAATGAQSSAIALPVLRAAVLWGAGLNCQDETQFALKYAGFDQVELIHTSQFLPHVVDLKTYDVLVIPGGFSYADDLGSGQVLAWEIHETMGDAIREFCAQGGFVLGICNGFQVLVKSGLLPGGPGPRNVTLTWNTNGHFTSKWVHLAAQSNCVCPFVGSLGRGELPIRHGEGRIQFRSPELQETVLAELFARGQVAFCYVDPQGKPAHLNPNPHTWNPNGSPGSLAGLCDATGQILGLMPHPEAFLFPQQHPQACVHGTDVPIPPWGLEFFQNMVRVLIQKKGRPVHQGKVRDSYLITPQVRYIETCDRMSAFDVVLNPEFPGKARILNEISSYWFKKTAHICKNHLIKTITDKGMLVKNTNPIPLEFIVRGYLVGSLFRLYEASPNPPLGLPVGLTYGSPLPHPLVSVTTKSTVHDEPVTWEFVLEHKILTQKQCDTLIKTCQDLFVFASEHCTHKGLILLDTKFEFAWSDDAPLLIDEVLTPDSSRYGLTQKGVGYHLDKEVLRQWILDETHSMSAHERDHFLKKAIPPEMIRVTMERYECLRKILCDEEMRNAFT